MLCSRVHNFWVNQKFVVLYFYYYSVEVCGYSWKIQNVSYSSFPQALFLHCQWDFFSFPQAYIRRGWEGLWWDFGQRERNESWWPNPRCLTDPQWASENQQYGGRGEQSSKVGILGIDWECIATLQSMEISRSVAMGLLGRKLVWTWSWAFKCVREIKGTSLGWGGNKLQGKGY